MGNQYNLLSFLDSRQIPTNRDESQQIVTNRGKLWRLNRDDTICHDWLNCNIMICHDSVFLMQLSWICTLLWILIILWYFSNIIKSQYEIWNLLSLYLLPPSLKQDSFKKNLLKRYKWFNKKIIWFHLIFNICVPY